MSIGDECVTPHPYLTPQGIKVTRGGMTYRQWLIGMALTGETVNTLFSSNKYKEIAQSAITLADAVIAALDAEDGEQ